MNLLLLYSEFFFAVEVNYIADFVIFIFSMLNISNILLFICYQDIK